jgi:hypothetical protein
MTARQGYDLAETTYPLRIDAREGVTIPEEIRCLLDAGWTWDGDKLVHPSYKDIWRKYTKVDSPKIGSSQRFDAEIEQAVREARWREQRTRRGGQ